MMRHMHPIGYLVIAMMLFAGCTTPQSQDNTEEARAGIEATIAQWMAAFEQGDAAGIAACYTESANLMPPNQKSVSGRAAVQETFQGLIDAGLTARLAVVEVEGHGDTAFEIGKATIMGPDGQVVDDSKYIVIWKRVGTEWKMHRDIWNSNMPLPEAEG